METKKLRILMLNYEFPPLGGGGGVASYMLAKGFVKLGHEVDVVTTWFKGLQEHELRDGVNIYRVKVPFRSKKQTASMISLLAFPSRGYKKAIELAKTREYDFINTHFAIPTGSLGVKLARELKIPNILSIHGGDIYDPTKFLSPHRNIVLRKVVRKSLNKSDFVVAQSTNTKENAVKYYSPKKEISIIPLAYEPFKFRKVSRRRLGLSEEKKYVIGVGRLVKRKGFDKAIRAISLVNDSNVNLLIVGDGPEKQNLLSLAKSLGVQKRIHLLGHISEEEKFQYLANSNVFLLSSVHEGFGIVLQEAMQVGLPIVATNHGGQVDLIQDGNKGLLVSYNEEEMSRAITSLINLGMVRYDINQFNIVKIASDYINLIK